MKKNFTTLILMLFFLWQLPAQEAHIILITDANRDDEQFEFLMNQGFDVTKFWPGSLSEAGQDTIDMLNAADLVIIGRSPNSGDFGSPDKEAWNDLTVPVILNAQYVARSNRINWFNSTSAFHANEEPRVAYGVAADPLDPIFSNVSLMDGDSVAWCYAPHDFIDLDEATNGQVLVSYADTIPLVVRFDAGVEFYEGSGDMPAGPRTYFGFGNDNTEIVNFFPLSKEAKAAYVAEIYRLLGQAIEMPVFSTADNRVILVTDTDRDDQQFEWLSRQGLKVMKFWPGNLSEASQDTLDILNMADLVILGRSPNSGDFDSPDKEVWNNLEVPVILNAQYAARSNRINWFNSTSAFHANEAPPVAYGVVSNPSDPAFDAVTLMDGDSVAWCYPPHDFLDMGPTTNGEVLVAYADTVALVVRFDADIEFYEGSVDMPAGPRLYFGFGNDNTGPAYFFPLTREAKKVYLAEISRLIDLPEVPEVVFGAADFNVTLISDDDLDDPQMKFLEKNGMRVTKFWPGSLSEASQDTIDMLNATDLVIVGRSPGSGDFDSPDKESWNSLTVPLILNGQYTARSNRINWFNSTSAFHANDEPEVAYGATTMPDDMIFSNVNLMTGDSIDWCLPPHDFLDLDSTTNGEIVATFADTVPLVVRFETGVEFYEGSVDMPSGPRTYFGFGNDNAGPANYFPLTPNGQQVYLNEISNILDADLSVAKTVDTDFLLSELEYSVTTATLTPDFNPDSLSYILELVEDSNVVTLTAKPNSEFATVVGDSTIDVTGGEAISTNIVVTAENGNARTYEVTVIPYIDPTEPNAVSGVTRQLGLYPNPAINHLNVVSDSDISQVDIYNLLGKRVMSRKGDNQNKIVLNVGSIEPGMYLIRVDNGREATIRKFLKK
ncbi:MAG: T9SS type A sorting domain-containing protein [Bacteroidales bacterium]